MEPFKRLESTAAPLRIINVDTDMVIPKQYLKTITRSGLGKALFAESRYTDDGSENPDFPLNQPMYRNAKILIAGDNFGCGSSREHAPWALLDYGFRCLISSSFASIFYSNALKNGILPVEVDAQTLETLFNRIEAAPQTLLKIDLETQTLTLPDTPPISFSIAPYAKNALLEGRDEIDQTLGYVKEIETFEKRISATFPWL